MASDNRPVDLEQVWYILMTRFHLETTRSPLHSIRQDEWMVKVDLKDAYLRVPIHPDSPQYFQFVSQD